MSQDLFALRLASGLGFGLAGGLLIGLLRGLLYGIQSSVLPQRIIVNQGIHRSFRSAGLGGLVLGLMGGLVLGVAGGLLGWPGLGLALGLALGLVSGLCIYGGAAVIQHYNLRLLLSYCTPAPFNLVRWLEEARMRGLLVRAGGGYRFYHELLQRHFASHEEPGYPRVPILAEAKTKVGSRSAEAD